MAKDKYSATWVSHSSISDFLKCPRAYYLNNIYKDPHTGHKITLMSPPLALGQAVHEVVESLSVLPVEKRFDESLIEKFDQVWKKVSGDMGGFLTNETESQYKSRGEEMLRKLVKNPGPLKNLAVKINMNLPYYWLSEEENIILCGKIDWLEYLKDEDAVHIIDFKTGKHEESSESLQLPIYYLLVSNTQERPVVKASYWYLSKNDSLNEMNLPNKEDSYEKVLKIAKEISLARKLSRFPCPHKTGCSACKPLEAIVSGKGKLVGVNEYRQDVYVLDKDDDVSEATGSKIL
ncbi:RecB family exonuclease [Patescibacteria group bacterium]